MKNITALAVLVIIKISFLAINPLYCQQPEKNYKFSIGPQIGFVYAQAFEYVYPVPDQTRGELLSELTWDMKPVFYAGLQMDFGRANILSAPGFFSSLSFKAGLPGDSGVIENRDWMSFENSELTHFSIHDNKTRQFYIFDAMIGLTLPAKSFYFKPFVSGGYT